MSDPPTGAQAPSEASEGNRPAACSRSQRLWRCIAVAVPLAALTGVVSLAFAPGTFTPDSLDICTQVLTGAIGTWHTAIFAWALRVSGIAVTWWFPLTVVAFVGALYAVLRLAMCRRGAVAATVLIALAPTTLSWLGAISKDVWFAVAFLGSTAAVVRAARRDSGVVRSALLVGGLAAAWWAVAARPNGAVPVAAMLAFCLPVAGFIRRSGWARHPLVRIAARFGGAAVAVAAIMASQSALESLVVHPVTQYPDIPTYIFDLSALSIRTGRMLLPHDAIQRGVTVDDLRRSFDIRSGSRLMFDEASPVRLERLPSLGAAAAATTRELRSAWLHAIVAHPVDYLSHRIAYAWSLLGGSGPYLPNDLVPRTGNPTVWNCPLPARAEPSMHRVARSWLVLADRSNLIRGWVFVGLIIVGALCAGWRRPEVRGLVAGGLASTATYVVMGAATSFRYSWFAALCALILCAMSLARLPEAFARRRGSATRSGVPRERDDPSRPESTPELVSPEA